MPWKQWAYLERVTSPDFQNYLQNQTVPQFLNVAQRDSVYTPVPPPAGALCITTDQNVLWAWTGSAWAPVGRPVALARWRQPAQQSIASQTVVKLTGLTADVTKNGITFANDSFTVPRSGYYRVSGTSSMSMSVVMSSGNPTVHSYVFVNGANSVPLQTAQVVGQIVNGTFQSTPYSRVIPLNANDVLDFRVQQTWTAALNTWANLSWGDIQELGIPL